MFRMITLALTAAATIVVAAAAPTAASAADGWRHDSSRHNWRDNDGWRQRHHDRSRVVVRFAAPTYAYAPRCHVSRRWVHTHWGWRLHKVRVCR